MTFHCIFTDYSSVELTYQNIRSTLLVATCIFLLLTTDIIIDQDLSRGGGGGKTTFREADCTPLKTHF